MAIGTIAAIAGKIDEDKNKKRLERTLANAPKYKITDEAYANQVIAKSEAYGRDRAVQGQEENIAQQAATDVAAAKDITSSTSALLDTISKINANKNANLRGLGQQEAALQAQKKSQLLNVNQQMIDEKDKAWNYNENMPFQMRVAMYRDKIKSSQEQQLAGLAYEGETVSSFASSIGGMMACDERIKNFVTESEPGLEEIKKLRPVSFRYNDPHFGNMTKHHLGFIAQEVKNVIPEAVSHMQGYENYLQIDTRELIPVLVKAIQQQQEQINELKAILNLTPAA